MIRRLSHYAIRTTELDAARRFYVGALGLAVGPRPPFPFPGLWLYTDGAGGDDPPVHLIMREGAGSEGLGRYLGERALGPGGLDHVAFQARDWPAMRARLETCGVGYVERVVPGLGQRQVFVTDPAGLTVELNFPAD